MTIWSAEIKELEKVYDSFIGQYPDLEKELERLIQTDDENIVLIYSRRCLEVIITDLCECELKRPRKTEPLKGIIDKLNQEEKVPSYIIASMHSLNSLSTFGAHPKEYDPEQVKPVLNNLSTIIKWYLKYKTEKAEQEKKEKVTEHKDDRTASIDGGLAGIAGSPEDTDGRTAGTYGRSAHFDGSPPSINEPAPSQKTFKKPFIIVSGILVVAIILYIVFDQFNFFRKDKFEDIRDPEGEISIAVMPFENLTGDTTLNWFGKGISSLIINGLGNSSELAVRDDQTMFEVMESMNQLYTAGISPSIAKEVAKKAKAETYISGSFQGRDNTYWILVNLVNTESGEIIWTNKARGNLKSSGYLDLADSLCNEIKNYLEIKALEKVADYEFRQAYPKSAKAYRYYIEGMNMVLAQKYETGIKSLKKALEIDSTFTLASFYIAYAYCYSWQAEQAEIWTKKTYAGKEGIPPVYQPWLEIWYACYFGKSLQKINQNCDLLAESGINTRLLWSDLGITYCDFTWQFEKAITAFEKVMEIDMERGSNWKFESFYDNYGEALHRVGNHEREKEISEIGLNVFPNSNFILYRQAVCALSQGNTAEANEVLVKYMAKHKELGTSEYWLEQYLGELNEEANIMNQAELHFRKAYEIEPPGSIYQMGRLAYFLINNDINVDEGMEIVKKGLDIRPDNPLLLWAKGRGLYKQGNYEEAVQLLSKVWEEWSGFDINKYNQLQEAKQALANQNKTQ
jgi:TolB-like protein